MRAFLNFPCNNRNLVATLDQGQKNTGLMIVSGGNEIRSGAHAGQARLAQSISGAGYPVFRYDRRGIGDSEGSNAGFLSTADDIACAANAFRDALPHISRVVAFGNCDAATALALFRQSANIDALILANPWVIDEDNPETMPPPSAIRTRYLQKLKNPKALWALISGKTDLTKLFKGLKAASQKNTETKLGGRLAEALTELNCKTDILIASRDRTALAFIEAWESGAYTAVRQSENIDLYSLDSASHSFADDDASQWLTSHILDALKR